MADERITIVLEADDKASGPMGNLIGKMDQMAQKGGLVGSVLQGVGQQLGKIGFNLVTDAIGGLTGALGDSIGKAREEEVGIKRLDAALKANVAGWAGDTSAIEANIREKGKLGFADDELRDSFAKLIVRSGNVETAMRDQGLAMGYARLKGIDLGAASSVVAKAMEGNVKALKEMGIELRKGATESEVFGAIQEKVAGQVEAFADSSEGAALSMKIALDDVMEDIGGMMLPIVKGLAIAIRDDVIPALRNFGATLGELGTFIKPVVDLLGDLARAAGNVKGEFDKANAPIDQAGKTMVKNFQAGGEGAVAFQRTVKGVFKDFVADAQLAARGWTGSLGAGLREGVASGEVTDVMFRASERLASESGKRFAAGIKNSAALVKAATTDMTQHGIITPLQVASLKASIYGANVPAHTGAAIRSGMGAVRSAMAKLKWEMEHPINLAADKAFLKGELHSSRLARGLRSKNPDIRAAAQAEKDAINAELEKIAAREIAARKGAEFAAALKAQLALAVAAAAAAAAKINAALASGASNNANRGDRNRANGGPVSAGNSYTVGERGVAETLTMFPGGGGYVTSGGSRGGSSGGNTFNLNIHSMVAPTARQASDFARAFGPEISRYLAHNGK